MIILGRPITSLKILPAVVAFLLLATQAAWAVTIPTVPVGNAGNAADTTGFGAVSNDYRIGTNEVTNAQYVEFLNAKAASNPLGLYNTSMGSGFGGITQSGSSGSFTYATISGRENMPVSFVSWYDSIRFANWLHNGQGSSDTETGAYTLLGGTATPSNGLSITRNAGALWWLTSEDEWYKAAYHKNDGVTGNYFNYPTSSDITPTPEAPAGGSNSANYNNVVGDLTSAGAYVDSDSPYGTFDQGGNASEWNESLISGSFRQFRAGSFPNVAATLLASNPGGAPPTGEGGDIGFRVALATSDVNWIGPASGSWDNPANWDAPLPNVLNDVLIQPTTGLTVTGPAASTTIGALTIDAQTSGTAVLELQPVGTLTAQFETMIGARGRLKGDGQFNAVGGITNAGEIDLGISSLTLTGGTLTNTGVIRGNGEIDNTLDNQATGEVRVAAGQRLLLTGSGNTNAGKIESLGGEVEFTADLANAVSTGLITGENATFRFNGGLTNNGALALSFGTSRVFGDVNNSLSGVIAVAGNSQVTFYDDVANSGLLNVVTGSTLVSLGALTGNGNMGGGDVQALGDLAPGASPGVMAFGGDLLLGPLSALEAELQGTMAGSQHDQVNVAGAATLGGTLDVVLLNPFFPTPGDSFAIMTFASRSGEFATVNGAGFLNSQTYLLPIYTSTDLTLRGFIPGDGNLNDTVDAADYTVWANNFGTTDADLSIGDNNGDGTVDAADYTIWANNFGQMVVAPSSAAAAIPEPSTLLLAIVGIIGLSFCRRRRGR